MNEELNNDELKKATGGVNRNLDILNELRPLDINSDRGLKNAPRKRNIDKIVNGRADNEWKFDFRTIFFKK